ncbi:hypothetical protein [Marinobacterium rhizophilum]|uniref:hypothetical protein n=1 Tax=Marinobacterium rhizophilum TaxID=420402 RepID=UPI000399C8DB|nr:hypothetical protein [Marinobacterium rhizophilum]
MLMQEALLPGKPAAFTPSTSQKTTLNAEKTLLFRVRIGHIRLSKWALLNTRRQC